MAQFSLAQLSDTKTETLFTPARTRLINLFNQLPESTRAQGFGRRFAEYVFYSTVYNLKGQSLIKFFHEERQSKVGITNVQRGRIEGSSIFYLDAIRLTYAEKYKNNTKSEGIAEDAITDDDVINSDFSLDLPAVVKNAELSLNIGAVKFLEKLPLSLLASGNTFLEKGTYRLEQPYFLENDSDFNVEIALNKGTLLNGQILRLQLIGMRARY